jgi:protein-disulfide isomerase
MPTVIRQFVDTGKVILVFKNLPLAMHPLAPGAAAAGVCAGEQGKFWQMYDRLFAQPVRLAEADLRRSAGEIGLNLALYDACRAGTAPAKLIEADVAEADAVKITGTPTFILGRVEPDGKVRASDVLTGAKPVAEFETVLNRLLR